MALLHTHEGGDRVNQWVTTASYMFPRPNEMTLVNVAVEQKERLDSEKCTIGGQRWRGARIRTWNLPESSF